MVTASYSNSKVGLLPSKYPGAVLRRARHIWDAMSLSGAKIVTFVSVVLTSSHTPGSRYILFIGRVGRKSGIAGCVVICGVSFGGPGGEVVLRVFPLGE